MFNTSRIAAIFIVIFQLITLKTYSNQDDLNKGWESFKKNNTEDARKYFLSAADDKATSGEANLILSIMSTIDKTPGEAFAYFSKFYNANSDPNPYLLALWTTQCVTGSAYKNSDSYIDFLEELVESPKTNGMMKAYAYEALVRAYSEKGKFDKSDKYCKLIGSVMDWQMVGEFENISASGFDKDWGPLNYPDADHVFKNKRGADVHWFDLPEMRPGRWIDFSYHFYYRSSIVYAETFCESPIEQVVQLRLGTSGSLKAWINDFLVISESEERNNGMDTYVSTIKLNKGFNRILIQVGESEAGRSNFLCRITDDKGFNIPNLKFVRQYSDATKYDKNYNFKSEIVPIFAENYFEDKVAKEPSNLLNYILLAETCMLNDKTYEARKIITKAQELAPDCSYLLSQLLQVYIRDENRTSMSMTIEKIRDSDPMNPISLEYSFDEAYEKEDYVKSKEILSKLENIYGHNDRRIIDKKIKISAAEKKIEDLKNLVDEAYSKFPDIYNFVYLKYAIEKNSEKNKNKAIEIIKDYLDKHFNTEAYQILMDYYFENGDADKGFDILKSLIESNPCGIGYYNKIGRQYFLQRDYPKAIEYYKKCLRIAPFVGQYYGDLGQTYEQMNYKKNAIESYFRCLVYDPNDYEIRRSLRKLQDKKSVFDYFKEPDLYQLFRESPTAEQFTEDNSLVLLDETQKVVYDGGGSEEKHYFLVKVFNATGIDSWKEYYIPYSRSQELKIEKAEVIKKNGNKVRAEEDQGHIVFTSLEVGDAVSITYRLENYQSGKLSEQFWDKHYFSVFYPYLKSKYSLLISPDIKFNYLVTNSDMKPQIEKRDEFSLYVWEKENQPSVKYESYMPSLTDVGEVLNISSIPDWNFIVDWYSDLSRTKAKSDFEVKEIASKLFDSKTNLSKLEQVEKIYNYIIKNIRYSFVPFRQSGMIPQKASKTINTRMGDCKDVSTLFVALCKEIGVDAKLTLVNTRVNGSRDMVLPSIEFDHAIGRLMLDGKEYFIELTNDYNPFSTIYFGLMKSFALVIDKDNPKSEPIYIEPKTRNQNSIFRTSKVKFEGNKMFVEKDNIKTGGKASMMRSGFRDVGKETQFKNMQEAIGTEYPNTKLTFLDFDDNLKTTSDTLTYRYNYTVSNCFTHIADMTLLKLPFADSQGPMDFISNDKRKYPLDFWRFVSSDIERETININIPEGKKLVEIPETIRYSCNVADYMLDFKLEDHELIVTREMKYKDDYVPIDKYKEFSNFYENVISADTKQIGFK
jgi:tetratricopeptide (TPR) repeat protein